MKDTIIEYFRSTTPEITVQAPSRINLINPLDAVEADYWMPSVAINGEKNPLSVFCYFKERKDKISKIIIFSTEEDNGKYSIEPISEEIISKNFKDYKKKFIGDFKLIYGSIFRFQKTSNLFQEKFLSSNFEIGIITTIPRQSGLGGSAAIVVAILYGLSKFFKLDKIINNQTGFPINRDIIAEMATKVEDKDLKITGGYSDRYVISRGGLNFTSYCGKIQHKGLAKEPLAVYDRIDKIYKIKDIPIIICYSGILHESGEVHKRLRELYLLENPEIIIGYQRLADISWKSRFALMKKDWKKLGMFFRENTKIMNEIMNIAGFKYGIGLANNILITLIESHPDVYSVKLTGAGGGGSVFALVKPDKIDEVLHLWKKNLNDILSNEESFKAQFPNLSNEIRKELSNAQFYKITIHEGVHLIK